MKDTRRAGLDSFRLLCCTLVEDLEQGNTCTFRNESERQPDQGDPDQGVFDYRSFDCSSMKLGNALLALRAICGKEWRSIETWSRSIRQHYKQLQEVAAKLDGPSRICRNPRARRHGQERHDMCSLSNKFLGQIEQVYDSAVTGLNLQELGNHVYRVVSESPSEN